MNKIHAIALIVFLINPLNILAELSGYPGEIYALKVENQEISSNLIIKIDGDSYELIPLPFNKQGKTIKVNDRDILIKEKDFGESRITITNTSMVNLSSEDSQRLNSRIRTYDHVSLANMLSYSRCLRLRAAPAGFLFL